MSTRRQIIGFLGAGLASLLGRERQEGKASVPSLEDVGDAWRRTVLSRPRMPYVYDDGVEVARATVPPNATYEFELRAIFEFPRKTVTVRRIGTATTKWGRLVVASEWIALSTVLKAPPPPPPIREVTTGIHIITMEVEREMCEVTVGTDKDHENDLVAWGAVRDVEATVPVSCNIRLTQLPL